MNDNFNELNQLNQMHQQSIRDQESLMRQLHDENERRKNIMSDSGMFGEINWEKARQNKYKKDTWILPVMLSMALVLLFLGIVIF